MNFVKSSTSFSSMGDSPAANQNQGFPANQNQQDSRQGSGLGYKSPGSRPQHSPSQNHGGPSGRFGDNGPRGNFTGNRGGGGGFNRSPGRFNDGDGSQRFNRDRSFGGPQQSFGGKGEEVGASSSSSGKSLYGGFVKPQRQADQFEGGDDESSRPPSSDTAGGSRQPSSGTAGGDRPSPAPSSGHPYSGPRFPGSSAYKTSGRFSTSVEGGGPLRAGGRGLGQGGGGSPRFFGGGGGRGGLGSGGRGGFYGGGGSSSGDNFGGIEAANAAAARATRDATKHNAKCSVLPPDNVHLRKFRRLAEEIRRLKSKRPNAVDTIHSAANIPQITVQSEIESGPIVRGTGTFFCLVKFDGINIAVATSLNKRSSKIDAFEAALQKLNKPYQRIVEIDGTSKELQAADASFGDAAPRQTVIKPMSAVVADISGEGGDGLVNSMQRESNVEAIVDIKKKNYVPKDLRDCVIVEPMDHNSSVNGASVLRRSADFSKMLLEYDFAAHGTGGAVRCVLKLEGQTLADVIGYSKPASKVEASQKAVDVMRQMCWTILTKQIHDSNQPEITKDEMLDDLASCMSSTNAASLTTPIGDNNLGKKLLQKMGWTGGGMGKDGAGIAEPVSMKQVINREGLGLDASRGVSGDFRARLTEVLENYAGSGRQDDLVFSPHFRKDERVIIHNECRRLGLKSKSNGHGAVRYLIVRRKRSACQLLRHVMESGGETARYKVVPPGQRHYPWRPSGGPASSPGAPASNPGKAGPMGDGGGGGSSASGFQGNRQGGRDNAGGFGQSSQEDVRNTGFTGQRSHPGQHDRQNLGRSNPQGYDRGQTGSAGFMGQSSPQRPGQMGQTSPQGSGGFGGFRGQRGPQGNGPAGQNDPQFGFRGQGNAHGNTGLLGPMPHGRMGQNHTFYGSRR